MCIAIGDFLYFFQKNWSSDSKHTRNHIFPSLDNRGKLENFSYKIIAKLPNRNIEKSYKYEQFYFGKLFKCTFILYYDFYEVYFLQTSIIYFSMKTRVFHYISAILA
jgi:hypothetical protein